MRSSSSEYIYKQTSLNVVFASASVDSSIPEYKQPYIDLSWLILQTVSLGLCLRMVSLY